MTQKLDVTKAVFTARIQEVRLTPEMRKALSERAEREGKTDSQVIREALTIHLSDHPPVAAIPLADLARAACNPDTPRKIEQARDTFDALVSLFSAKR